MMIKRKDMHNTELTKIRITSIKAITVPPCRPLLSPPAWEPSRPSSTQIGCPSLGTCTFKATHLASRFVSCILYPARSKDTVYYSMKVYLTTLSFSLTLFLVPFIRSGNFIDLANSGFYDGIVSCCIVYILQRTKSMLSCTPPHISPSLCVLKTALSSRHS